MRRRLGSAAASLTSPHPTGAPRIAEESGYRSVAAASRSNAQTRVTSKNGEFARKRVQDALSSCSAPSHFKGCVSNRRYSQLSALSAQGSSREKKWWEFGAAPALGRPIASVSRWSRVPLQCWDRVRLCEPICWQLVCFGSLDGRLSSDRAPLHPDPGGRRLPLRFQMADGRHEVLTGRGRKLTDPLSIEPDLDQRLRCARRPAFERRQRAQGEAVTGAGDKARQDILMLLFTSDLERGTPGQDAVGTSRRLVHGQHEMGLTQGDRHAPRTSACAMRPTNPELRPRRVRRLPQRVRTPTHRGLRKRRGLRPPSPDTRRAGH